MTPSALNTKEKKMKQHDTITKTLDAMPKLSWLLPDGKRVKGIIPELARNLIVTEGWKGVPTIEQVEWLSFIKEHGYRQVKGRNARGLSAFIITKGVDSL
jgi:hypothetical protein